MGNIKRIGLVKSDFKDLYDFANNEDSKDQYIDNKNCPIAKALKRLGYKDVHVNPYQIRINGTSIDFDGSDFEKVEAAARRLFKGKIKTAYINR